MLGYISRLPQTGEFAFPRQLVLLGATGSIGVSALNVVKEHPDKFRILGLAGARNVKRLARQALTFRPPCLGVLNQAAALELRELLPPDYQPQIFTGPSGYVELARLSEADLVLSAIVGAAGLEPTLAAVNAGKFVALANKESLVLAGDLIRAACAASRAVLMPVDSEHNALFQALLGHDARDVRSLVLTASGGPFRAANREFLENVTPEQALKHPRWSMGAKISIDSATLMNKGLEVIEARALYGVKPSQIEVVVHPQSVVHSLVSYHDATLLAQLGPADMRLCISYCLSFPTRLPLSLKPLNLVELSQLTFEAPREELFPCLGLARQAMLAGASHQIVLNAANEVAVELFLKGRAKFLEIPEIIEEALNRHSAMDVSQIESILELDRRTRQSVWPG